MPVRASRYDDDLVLYMLARRTNGDTAPQIAADLNMTCAKVRVATNRAFNADLEESGEPVDDVMAGYW